MALLFLYTWQLDRVPPYFQQDEAGFGLASYLLATTHRDYFGNWLPVYVGYFDSHQLGGAMLPYLGVPFVLAFGALVTTLRLAMALTGMLTLLLFGALAWRLTSNRWLTLAGVWLLATTPLFFIQSRVFLEMLLPIPFIVCWLLLIVEYQRGGRERFLLLSAAVLGVGFYSYGTARMIMPVYLAITLAVSKLAGRCSWRAIVASAAIFAATMIPAALFVLANRDLYFARFASLTWLTPDTTPTQAIALYLDHYLACFDPSDLFLAGDASLVHSTGQSGVFLKATVPLAVLGVGWITRVGLRSSPIFSMILVLSLVLFPLPLALLAEYHAPSRATYILPIYATLCLLGLSQVISFGHQLPLTPLIPRQQHRRQCHPERSLPACHPERGQGLSHGTLLLGEGSPRGDRTPFPWRIAAMALVVILVLALATEFALFFRDYFATYPARAAASGAFGANDKPGAYRALFADPAATAVFVDTEDDTTLTYARFFKAETRFPGEVLPAPPEWANRLPPGGRLLTARPEAYGASFQTLATIPNLTPTPHPYAILLKRP